MKILSLTLTGLLATYSSLGAAANLVLGERSQGGSYMYSLESALIESANGQQGYADLDSIDAALEMTGFCGAEALVAWDVFADACSTFEAGFVGGHK
ncbi:MAG: hypothetical protein ABSF95_23025 [Verrucomicrobiota bacterium]